MHNYCYKELINYTKLYFSEIQIKLSTLRINCIRTYMSIRMGTVSVLHDFCKYGLVPGASIDYNTISDIINHYSKDLAALKLFTIITVNKIYFKKNFNMFSNRE